MKKPGTFRKGDPRINRNGRGRGKLSIPDILRKIGAEKIPKQLADKLPEDIRQDKHMLTALMRATYYRALDGESWAVAFIAERTEGKVKDTLAIEQGTKLGIVEELVDAENA